MNPSLKDSKFLNISETLKERFRTAQNRFNWSGSSTLQTTWLLSIMIVWVMQIGILFDNISIVSDEKTATMVMMGRSQVDY